MYNEDKSIVVVQNGEIYNYKEIREDLVKRGHHFATRSDTEVLVHGFEEFDEDLFDMLNGDYCIAFWNNVSNELYLARDRMGVHPLYYCNRGDKLVFASEVKCLLCWEETPRDVEPNALDQYLTFRYVLNSDTLFAGIKKVPPGHFLKFADGRIMLRQYWTVQLAGRPQEGHKIEESAERLLELLEDSVRIRLRSDVPVGSYLSGGLDSSAIVSLMRRLGGQEIHTFTVGFGAEIDEISEARTLAEQFGTQHHEIFVGPMDFELLPKIVWHLDEPIGDAIIIPTYLLAACASRNVKVAMTGEGADEIWGGYIHYLAMNYGSVLRKFLPGGLIGLLGRSLRHIPLGLANRIFPYPANLGKRDATRFSSYLQKLAGGTIGEEYLELASVYSDDSKESLYTDQFKESLDGYRILSELPDTLHANFSARLDQIMQFDRQNWLPNYTLLKQDKLGFSSSVELRVPFLDHRIVEFAAELPSSYKVKGSVTKHLLREGVRGILPQGTRSAQKKAFYFPTDQVFDSRFESFVRDTLGSSKCLQRGYFRPSFISEKLKQIKSKELLENKQLMALLILELWFQAFVDGRATH